MTRHQWASVDRFDVVYAQVCELFGLTDEQARALRGQRSRIFHHALTECLRLEAGPLPPRPVYRVTQRYVCGCSANCGARHSRQEHASQYVRDARGRTMRTNGHGHSKRRKAS